MESHRGASTGIPGLDRTIDHLRLGDNVVWQVDSVADFAEVAAPFVARTLAEGREVHYVRFASHAPVVTAPAGDGPGVVVHHVDPAAGFEPFATEVHDLIEAHGRRCYYVFDCLSELLDVWHSDLMVMNFFKVTCPYLFELDTLAYFCLLRDHHAAATIAGVRETTQLLLELHRIGEDLYVHPLKVWARYSPTMFFPHRLVGGEVVPVTSSEESARLFAALGGRTRRADHWEDLLDGARAALVAGDTAAQEAARDLLMGMMVGQEGRVVALCRTHLRLADLLQVAARLVGTGRIGGKSVGMVVARAILGHDPSGRFAEHLEAHDSFHVGSDHFYTYVVANGWWGLRMEQKRPEHFMEAGERLHAMLAQGTFPPVVQEDFWRVLDHFGQSPIIVRSSSLLEDDYGNAFAGKYESVFLVNQGSPEDRYRAFEDAVRTVYASSMSHEALAYRLARGLEYRDEQMALLVQRVSGDRHGDLFFPHAAGVGNSSNLYTWSPDLDPEAGMLRLVVGLGTRAVDRAGADHARIVALDAPLSQGRVDRADAARWTQRRADVLSLSEDRKVTVTVTGLARSDTAADWSLFLQPDPLARARLEELGSDPDRAAPLVDFRGLFERTDFVAYMRDLLATLRRAYDYPVDIEFTVNLVGGARRGAWDFRLNLLQCRPLQTRGMGHAVHVGEPADPSRCLVATHGSFMGGNADLALTHVVLVRADAYLGLGTRDRHEVARTVGSLNRALEGASVMYLGPGRWGATMASLGVPVSFAEISGARVLGEYTHPAGNFRPELSWGSHFFQDLVEAGIFYVAVDDAPGTVFNPHLVLERPNLLAELASDRATGPAGTMEGVIHVAAFDDLRLRADVVSQRLVCS